MSRNTLEMIVEPTSHRLSNHDNEFFSRYPELNYNLILSIQEIKNTYLHIIELLNASKHLKTNETKDDEKINAGEIKKQLLEINDKFRKLNAEYEKEYNSDEPDFEKLSELEEMEATLISTRAGLHNTFKEALEASRNVTYSDKALSSSINNLKKQLSSLDTEKLNELLNFNVESLREAYNKSLSENASNNELTEFYSLVTLDSIQNEIEEVAFLIETARKFANTFIPGKSYPESFKEANMRILLFSKIDNSLAQGKTNLSLLLDPNKDYPLLDNLGETLLEKAMPMLDEMTDFARAIYLEGLDSDNLPELYAQIRKKYEDLITYLKQIDNNYNPAFFLTNIKPIYETFNSTILKMDFEKAKEIEEQSSKLEMLEEINSPKM